MKVLNLRQLIHRMNNFRSIFKVQTLRGNIFKQNFKKYFKLHFQQKQEDDETKQEEKKKTKKPSQEKKESFAYFQMQLAISLTIYFIFINYFYDYRVTRKLIRYGTYTEFLDDLKNNAIEKIYIQTDLASQKSIDNFVEEVLIKKNNEKYKLIVSNLNFFLINLENFQKDNNLNKVDVHHQMIPIAVGPIKKIHFGALSLMLAYMILYKKKILSNLSGISQNTTRFTPETKLKTKFNDIAGLNQAKIEIQEFVDFLKHPQIYTKLGARMPRGALLTGPPGTGKTLLAKACATEAGISFFSISGSEFVQKYVGMGASRVRDLFQQAKIHSPSIIFIDEIDAIGKKRETMSFNQEKKHTLNQLLVEMDGFKTDTNVVVLAATNRAEVLDPALKRPGRFDRHIDFVLPSIEARKEIFKLYLKKLTLEKHEDIVEIHAKRLATLTPGFSGADIANICNEAAIQGARQDNEFVTKQNFEDAVERVIGGLKRYGVVNEKEREIVAYHESGHAVAGWFLEGADPLIKVTIIPRSKGALGFAQYLGSDLDLYTQNELLDRLVFILGGRVSEEIFFNKISTGASDDLKKAYELAYALGSNFGMLKGFEYMAIGKSDQEYNYLGERKNLYSEKTSLELDEQIASIIQSSYLRARELLKDKKTEIEKLAKLLLEKEQLGLDELIQVLGPRPFPPKSNFKNFLDYKKDKRFQDIK